MCARCSASVNNAYKKSAVPVCHSLPRPQFSPHANLMFHAAALRTGLVSQGQSMPTKPRSSRSAEAVRRDDQFVLQTSAVTWEILLFVLTEEGVSRDLFERELRNSKPQVTVDDHSFLKAVDTIRDATKLLLRDNGDEMRQLSTALNTSDGHLYSSYLAMARSAIGSDIRWGRIVALMGFTGIVAARLAKEHEAEKVGSLLGWERTFMCETCHDWIEDCGGWVSLHNSM